MFCLTQNYGRKWQTIMLHCRPLAVATQSISFAVASIGEIYWRSHFVQSYCPRICWHFLSFYYIQFYYLFMHTRVSLTMYDSPSKFVFFPLGLDGWQALAGLCMQKEMWVMRAIPKVDYDSTLFSGVDANRYLYFSPTHQPNFYLLSSVYRWFLFESCLGVTGFRRASLLGKRRSRYSA